MIGVMLVPVQHSTSLEATDGTLLVNVVALATLSDEVLQDTNFRPCLLRRVRVGKGVKRDEVVVRLTGDDCILVAERRHDLAI